LVQKLFPNIQTNYKNHDWLGERAILAAKNKDVNELNNIIQSNIPSEGVTYKSVDTAVEADYPTEFLNSLDPPGMPSHVLQLKVESLYTPSRPGVGVHTGQTLPFLICSAFCSAICKRILCWN
jgi:hypothetical protein